MTSMAGESSVTRLGAGRVNVQTPNRAAKVYSISAAEVKKVMAADRIQREKLAYSERADPHFLTYGPKTRREFLKVFDPAN